MRRLLTQKKLDDKERAARRAAGRVSRKAGLQRVVQGRTQAVIAKRHLEGAGLVRLVRRFVRVARGETDRPGSYVIGEESTLLMGMSVVRVEEIAEGLPEGEIDLIHHASFREFVRWTMMNPKERKKEGLPLTLRAFADAHEVTTHVLGRWRSTALFEQMTAYLLREWQKETLPLLWRAAVSRGALMPGRDGNPDRKMLLEMLGAYTNRKQVEVSAAVSVEHRVSQPESVLREAAVAHLKTTRPGLPEDQYDALLDAVLALDAAAGGAPRVPMPPRLGAGPAESVEDAVVVGGVQGRLPQGPTP